MNKRAYAAVLSRRAKKAARTRQRRALVRGSVTGKTNMTEGQFNKLPKSAQRILLALDILAMIRAKLVRVSTGTYVEFADSYDAIPEGVETAQANSPEGRACLLNKNAPCTICAKGGLMLAHIMRANNAMVEDVAVYEPGNEEVTERLQEKYKVFSKLQLEAIEAAFEGTEEIAECHGIDVNTLVWDHLEGGYVRKVTKDGQLIEQAIKFGHQHLHDNRRLAAIMINIVLHEGEFMPQYPVSVGDVGKVLSNPKWGVEYADATV